MNRQSRWVLTGVIALFGVGGCGVDITPSDDDSDGESAPASEAPDQSGEDPTTDPPAGQTDPPSGQPTESDGSGPCPVGTWRLRKLRATGDADAARMEFSGGGSLIFSFTDDGTWTLADDGSQPLRASLVDDGYRLDGEAAVDGTAIGTYRSVGAAYTFDLESSDGEARISAPGYHRTVGMADFVEVLLPTGQATLDCAEDVLRLDSEGVIMRLALQSPQGSDAPASSGDRLTIETSGTRACSGRSITIDAELEDVELTGECDVVKVVSDNSFVTARSVQELVVPGSLNEIDVATVATISISGSSNEIFWGAAADGGEPTIKDDGPFNTVEQR